LLLYFFLIILLCRVYRPSHTSQKRPRRASLHLARSSADPGAWFCRSRGAGLLTVGARVCKPRAGLQTPGVRVCTQGSGSANPRHAGLHLACMSADPRHANLQIQRLSLALAPRTWQSQHQVSAPLPKSELTIFSPTKKITSSLRNLCNSLG